MNERRTVTLSEEGFLMRLYNTWRDLKGYAKTERKQIDLCHFMRVCLIFGPVRIFFFYALFHIGRYAVAAFELVATVLVALLLVEGGENYPEAMLFGLVVITAGVALGCVIALALIQFLKWRRIDEDRADAVLVAIPYYGFIWLWYPIYLLVRALIWVGERTMVPFWKWLTTYHYFAGRSFKPLMALGLLLIALAVGWLIFLYVRAWVLYSEKTLIFTAVGVGTVVAIAIIFLCCLFAAEAIKRRPASSPKPKEENENKGETSRALWAFVVAKKHKVCPLIEVKK